MKQRSEEVMKKKGAATAGQTSESVSPQAFITDRGKVIHVCFDFSLYSFSNEPSPKP